ncbi:hypothetical protein CSB20_09675 [bacterium DOLZORAL124_64_63]|nr:MAG: hypothetical protein CSB20_09675 [bacterium DOLZORAL124_64_63]
MDREIGRLAARMRDEGVPPPRDLWPEIDARLEDRPGAVGRQRSDYGWRLAAVAAALLLLLGSGYFSGGRESLPAGGEMAATEGGGDAEAPTSLVALAVPESGHLLRMMNETIGELEEAQALVPENLKLSRLTVLAHQGRAELLRAAARRTL